SLNETGYLQSINGAPDPNLYYASNQPPALQVLQTDFVWGFLTAVCVGQSGNPICPPAAKAAPSLKAEREPGPRRSLRDVIQSGAGRAENND
ncbi:MAG TPA: hypothetical protein VJ724_08030, partial [Tahibacter sp.]|nr:hypothetical protein [Tahibacter sp.]